MSASVGRRDRSRPKKGSAAKISNVSVSTCQRIKKEFSLWWFLLFEKLGCKSYLMVWLATLFLYQNRLWRSLQASSLNLNKIKSGSSSWSIYFSPRWLRPSWREMMDCRRSFIISMRLFWPRRPLISNSSHRRVEWHPDGQDHHSNLISMRLFTVTSLFFQVLGKVFLQDFKLSPMYGFAPMGNFVVWP